jgi:hypothetical protein
MLKSFLWLCWALNTLQDRSVLPNRADGDFRSANIDSPDDDHVISFKSRPKPYQALRFLGMPALLTAAGNRPHLLGRFDQNTCNEAVYRYRASCESSELDHICAVSTRDTIPP